MEKRGINLTISLGSRVFYFLVSIGLFFLILVGVFAYNSGKSPSVFGHDSMEIEGLDSFVKGIVDLELDKRVSDDYCDERNVIYDSCSGGVSGWTSINLPETCYSDVSGSGCFLVQKIINGSGTVVRLEGTRFIQDRSSGIWHSSSTGFNSDSNGNSVSRSIFSNYGELILVWDDESLYTEKEKSKISIRDSHSTHCHKIYAC